MKNELPGDPTLPPGVTMRDIDPDPICWDDFNPEEDDERDRFDVALERAERYFDDNRRDE